MSSHVWNIVKSSKGKFRSRNSELGSLNGISDSWQRFPLEISPLHPRLGLSTLLRLPRRSIGHLFHERTVSARVSIRGRRWETDDYIDRVLVVPRAGGKGEGEVISIFGALVPGSMIGVALMRAVWMVAASGHWYYLPPWSAPTLKITADERERSENEEKTERKREKGHFTLETSTSKSTFFASSRL